ncbi:hypothetical protein A3Q56_06541 [Intoshia linei]|uniref:Heparan sulphate-N-deacetylase deacetylase domain-containing protein n=1 Tax=Intoshia linei TaxID=1819745 RepID=A0A177AV84_9BILA|nr:hypothetical protein A3Q56_06541 [Intoshia linei]
MRVRKHHFAWLLVFLLGILLLNYTIKKSIIPNKFNIEQNNDKVHISRISINSVDPFKQNELRNILDNNEILAKAVMIYDETDKISQKKLLVFESLLNTFNLTFIYIKNCLDANSFNIYSTNYVLSHKLKFSNLKLIIYFNAKCYHEWSLKKQFTNMARIDNVLLFIEPGKTYFRSINFLNVKIENENKNLPSVQIESLNFHQILKSNVTVPLNINIISNIYKRQLVKNENNDNILKTLNSIYYDTKELEINIFKKLTPVVKSKYYNLIYKMEELNHIVFTTLEIDGWVMQTLITESIAHLLNRSIDLMKIIHINIDRIFDIKNGIKLKKDDVKKIIELQDNLNQYIENFKFDFGFDGAMFKEGFPNQIEGDEFLIDNNEKFLWHRMLYRQVVPHILPKIDVFKVSKIITQIINRKVMFILMSYDSFYFTEREYRVNEIYKVFEMLHYFTNFKFSTKKITEFAQEYFEKLNENKPEPVYWTNACNFQQSRSIMQDSSLCDRIPKFIILGSRKAGTGALQFFLKSNPRLVNGHRHSYTVITGDPEMKYFDMYYHESFDKYLATFPKFKFGHNKTIYYFEKTPNYFNTKKTPERIFNLFPNMKLVVLLKDPVKRTFSAFHEFGNGNFNEKIKNMELRNDSRDYLIGEILDSARLVTNPIETMYKVADFLKLPYYNYESVIKYHNEKGFYCLLSKNGISFSCLPSSKGRNYEPMTEESKSKLETFFQEPNKKLCKILKNIQSVNLNWLNPYCS